MSPSIKTFTLITAATLITSTAFAWGSKLQDTQTLRLSLDDLSQFRIDVGAGKLHVIGDSQLDEIIVEAEIYQNRANDNYELSLEKKSSSRAVLIADANTGSGWSNWNNDSWIDLTIRVPASLNLDIDDGSGEIKVMDINGKLEIDDGSGKIEIQQIAGDVFIDDGSGSIYARDLGGDIEIDDGSGGIKVRNVAGVVTVADGSGSIDVDGAASFVLADDGSGGVDIDNVSGEIDMGS